MRRASPSIRRRAGTYAMGALSAAVLLGAAGCASGSTAKNPFGGDAGMKQIRIEVVNLNWNDATLYALRGEERHRLGIVSGKGEARYRLDWPTSTSLRIVIDLLASDSCVTHPLQVDPGDEIQLQIESDLSLDPDCQRNRRR